MKRFIGKALPKVIGFYLNVLSFAAPKLASKKALKLFTTPRKGKVLENQSSFLNTAVQEVLRLDETPIMTYRWEGKNKTVLLAHGWESNSFRWHKLIKVLQERYYNIIAIDAPAHGKSASKRFNAVLYAEFINVVVQRFQPEIMIGHSVGGMASAFFQKKYQHSKLEKLILLGAPSEFENVFKNYTLLLGLNKHLKKHVRSLIIERFGDTPESFSTADSLQDEEVKGLIIHDRDDKIIHFDEALLIKKKFKNSTLITTKGLGHSLHFDSVNQDILEFLNS